MGGDKGVDGEDVVVFGGGDGGVGKRMLEQSFKVQC